MYQYYSSCSSALNCPNGNCCPIYSHTSPIKYQLSGSEIKKENSIWSNVWTDANGKQKISLPVRSSNPRNS